MGTSSKDNQGSGRSRRKIGISASLRQDSTTKYIRNSKTISGRLLDEVVMMDPEQGKYFSLNPAATRIWDLLEKPISFDDLCVMLMGEYEVEAERCAKEVTDLIDEMLRMRLVVRFENEN